jgi:hypothetical protein
MMIFVSCETTIDPRLEQAEPVLVVDAWINNKADTQRDPTDGNPTLL